VSKITSNEASQIASDIESQIIYTCELYSMETGQEQGLWYKEQ